LGELVRWMLFFGFVAGTQPLTLMGLLPVTSAERSRACGWAYLSGCFVVESSVLLAASVVVGTWLKDDWASGRPFISVRVAVGAVLVVVGLLLRRPAKKPQPELPKTFVRLQSLTPRKAFVAGAMLTDVQGPALGSLAIAAAGVGLPGRVGSLVVYTCLASGIRIAAFTAKHRSARVRGRLDRTMAWVMQHRRPLMSWVCLVAGVVLVGEGVLELSGVF
jgi:Sap, sulfolipid-1-addressing protein